MRWPVESRQISGVQPSTPGSERPFRWPPRSTGQRSRGLVADIRSVSRIDSLLFFKLTVSDHSGGDLPGQLAPFDHCRQMAIALCGRPKSLQGKAVERGGRTSRCYNRPRIKKDRTTKGRHRTISAGYRRVPTSSVSSCPPAPTETPEVRVKSAAPR